MLLRGAEDSAMPQTIHWSLLERPCFARMQAMTAKTTIQACLYGTLSEWLHGALAAANCTSDTAWSL